MTSIGGYFELELPQRAEYHKAAIALNTGRNALEYILQVRDYQRVYLPYYSCEVLLEPFKKLGVDYVFYHVNTNLELDDTLSLEDDEALLYINYFGLKQGCVSQLASIYDKQLIVDNTQAFYAEPLDDIDTFYSCRKFFGVSDGAYLYCDKRLDDELEQDQSWERMTHLLKRIDVSPEAAYTDFRDENVKLRNNPIRQMSTLTHRIMASIDYDSVAERRRENFRYLDYMLKEKNGISLPLTDRAVPMVYPFLTEDGDLRQRLIDNRIYVAQYWPNVLQYGISGSTDEMLALQLLPLPIDQRYGAQDMDRIIALI